MIATLARARAYRRALGEGIPVPAVGGSMTCRIVVYTEEPVVVAGLQALFQSEPDLDLAAVCNRPGEVGTAAIQSKANLILYGVSADADAAGLPEIFRLTTRFAVVLWAREIPPEMAHRAVEMGVRGMVSTTASPENLKECIRIATAGELWVEKSLTSALLTARTVPLTRRQSQIVSLLAQGLKNKEIASALGISESTVKAYLYTLFEKVGAKDRFELALFGLRHLKNIGAVKMDTDLTPQLRSMVTRRPHGRSVA